MFDFLLSTPALLLVLPFVLGATTEGGVLGKTRGKVGNVVFSDWKGINTIRAYTVPANPQTSAQQDNRSVFGTLAEIGSELNTEVLQPYWDPFYSKMSGFNAWVRDNKTLMGSAFNIDKLSLLGDSGASPGHSGDTYDSMNGELFINQNPSELPDGVSAADLTAVAVVWHNVQERVLYAGTLTGDPTQPPSVTIEEGLAASDLSVAASLVDPNGTGSKDRVQFYATGTLTPSAA